MVTWGLGVRSSEVLGASGLRLGIWFTNWGAGFGFGGFGDFGSRAYCFGDVV